MKKLVSLAIAAILVFVLAVPAFALEPETQVIDLGTVDLGNGVSYHTVFVSYTHLTLPTKRIV